VFGSTPGCEPGGLYSGASQLIASRCGGAPSALAWRQRAGAASDGPSLDHLVGQRPARKKRAPGCYPGLLEAFRSRANGTLSRGTGERKTNLSKLRPFCAVAAGPQVNKFVL
jgi:hypothetical protein